MLSRYIEYIKGHSLPCSLHFRVPQRVTCQDRGALQAAQSRTDWREFGQKSLNRCFFYFVKISLTKIVRNLGPIQYIDTEWALRTTFWHSDSPDIWSPKALRHSVCCAGRKENLPYLVAEIFRHASFGHPDAQRARDAVAFVIICRI
jgi:hypothetical protein